MRYQDKTFTLPTSSGVSQAEWDRIFKEPVMAALGPDDKPNGFRCLHDPVGIVLNKNCGCPQTRAEGRNRRKAYRLSDINRTVESKFKRIAAEDAIS